MADLFKDLFNNSFTSIANLGKFTVSTTLCIVLVVLLLGLCASLTYMYTSKREGVFTRSFASTLIILPAIISAILIIAAGNAGVAIGIAGTFSVVRYRSLPGDPKEIAYIFFALAIGVACGTGYLLYGVIFTIILCAVMFIISMANYGKTRGRGMVLKVNVPENLNYTELFDDIFTKYTVKNQLQRIKTKEFGAVYELTYLLTLKNEASTREFLDDIRCRNGNLNITLVNDEFAEKKY